MKRSTPYAMCLLALLGVVQSHDLVAAKDINCSSDHTLISSDIEKCMLDEYVAVDEELNRVYQQALRYIKQGAINRNREGEQFLRDGFRRSLVTSQRQWLKFRDYYCGAVMEYLGLGGSGLDASQYDCKIRLTRQRVEQLSDDFLVH